ncbi:uncharacterized protein LOC144452961 [Glandiceps talaboti]
MAVDLGYKVVVLITTVVGMWMISADADVMKREEFISPCTNLSEQCEVEDSCAYTFLFPKDKVKGCRGFRRTIMIMRKQNDEIVTAKETAQQCVTSLEEQQADINELMEFKNLNEYQSRKQVRRLQRQIQQIEEDRIKEQQTVKNQNDEIEYLTIEKNRQQQELLLQKAIINSLEERMVEMRDDLTAAMNTQVPPTTTTTTPTTVAMETTTATTATQESPMKTAIIEPPKYFEYFTNLTLPESIRSLVTFEINCVSFMAYTTSNGTHISMFDNGTILPVQHIGTDSGDINYNGLEFFKIADRHFLGITNCRLGNHCIYRWENDTFVEFQIMSLNGVNSWQMHYFRGKTSQGKKHFLALASFSRYDTRLYANVNDINSVIYVLKDDRFVTFQTIATNGARGVTSVTIGNYVYVCFANSWSVKVWPRFNIKSEVFRLSADGFYFSRHQSLPIAGGSASITPFHFAGNTYLMDVFWQSGKVGEGLQTESPLFIWDEATRLFAVHQVFLTHNGRMVCPFTVKNQLYFVVTNHGDSYTDPFAVIYRRSESGFIEHQRLQIVGGDSCATFEDDDDLYIIIGNTILVYPN